MTDPTLGGELDTPAQTHALKDILERFDCDPTDWRQISAFDLPAGYVSVIFGEQKGRPYAIGIAEDGRVSS